MIAATTTTADSSFRWRLRSQKSEGRSEDFGFLRRRGSFADPSFHFSNDGRGRWRKEGGKCAPTLLQEKQLNNTLLPHAHPWPPREKLKKILLPLLFPSFRRDSICERRRRFLPPFAGLEILFSSSFCRALSRPPPPPPFLSGLGFSNFFFPPLRNTPAIANEAKGAPPNLKWPNVVEEPPGCPPNYKILVPTNFPA